MSAPDSARTGPSALSHLEGSLSGSVRAADVLAGLDPADDRPLLARYDLPAAARTLTRAALRRRPGGLWRWRELLPVADPASIVDLGAGGTPLVAVPRLAGALDLSGLRLKAEGHNPTGTFKARGMATAVSRNRELGAGSFLVPSAGNAAGALATYGAAAGIPVTVLMPADAPALHRAEVLVAGAELILVDGLISDCAAVGARLADRTGALDVATLTEPYRVEGKKTMGFELAEQHGWRLPDVVVYPTGGGTGLIGIWKAFEELDEIGLLEGPRPRMVAAQAAGCAPIVRAFEQGERFAAPWEQAATRAGGLRVPAAVGDFLVLDALRASGGTAVAVPEADLDGMQHRAGRLGAGLVSPETATALAAAARLRADGRLGADERVVVLDTGIGHKAVPPPDLPTPPVVAPDVDVARLVGD